MEGQNPLGIQPDKGYQSQEKGLLQVHEQQKEDRENMRPLLNQMCVLVMEDLEKEELPNAFFFISVFHKLTALQEEVEVADSF